jgi:hypothetical protein
MSEKKKLETILVEESNSEGTFTEITDEASWAQSAPPLDEEVVIVEENVQVSWSGVSSCDHTDRIQAEVRTHLQRWIEKKLYEHRDWRYLRAGAKASSVRCRSWRDTWTGRRSCGCNGVIPFWIEFAKP